MLQSMRNFSKSLPVSIMLGLLAVSFALWGIGDIFRGSTTTWVAKVGSARIEEASFQREYRNTIRATGARQQSDITPEQAKKLGIPNATLQRMIGEAALDNYAADFGVTTSDASVTREIQAQQAFQGAAGTFDHAMFLQRINTLGYSEEEFIATMKREIANTQLRSAAEDGLTAPIGYINALMAYFTEARSADYVVLTPTSIGAIAPPDDATLAAYVKAHPERFSTPEYRSLTYAGIGPEDVEAKVTPTDKQLQDAYAVNKAKYNVPESREADQISFLTQAEAAAARARINSDADYDALARARKLTPKTLTIGVVTKDELTDRDRAEALFSLPVGTISQPVKGPFGYVLLRVRKITPAIFKSFDDAKVELQKLVKTELAQSALVDIANKFTDAQGGGADVAQAGRETGMHVVIVPVVDSHGNAPDGSKANVGGPEFLQHVFASEIGEDGDAFQTQDGHLYAVKIAGSVPPRLKSLDTVRAAALETWMRDARAKAFRQKADALAAQANKDGSLAGVASALGTTVQTSGRIERNATTGVFSAALVKALFLKPAGVAVIGPAGKGEGYVIARTSGVSHPHPSATDQTYRSIGLVLSRQIASDLSSSLANAEKTRQGVDMNRKLFDQAVGGETG